MEGVLGPLQERPFENIEQSLCILRRGPRLHIAYSVRESWQACCLGEVQTVQPVSDFSQIDLEPIWSRFLELMGRIADVADVLRGEGLRLRIPIFP